MIYEARTCQAKHLEMDCLICATSRYPLRNIRQSTPQCPQNIANMPTANAASPHPARTTLNAAALLSSFAAVQLVIPPNSLAASDAASTTSYPYVSHLEGSEMSLPLYDIFSNPVCPAAAAAAADHHPNVHLPTLVSNDLVLFDRTPVCVATVRQRESVMDTLKVLSLAGPAMTMPHHGWEASSGQAG